MAIRYLNIKRSHGVENVDQLDQKDFPDFRAFRKEQNRLKHEYELCGSYYAGCYWSSRKGNA